MEGSTWLPAHLLLCLLSFMMMMIASATRCQASSLFPSKLPKVCAIHGGCMSGRFMPGFQIEKFEAFLGIPYALPPVGDLRFSNPKAYPHWKGVLDMTAPKMDCIQKNYLLPNPTVYGVEDCLYLNVYRPVNASFGLKHQLPVMVYIHGGGWFSGSARPALLGPEYFMDTQEVILVTFAYRLGALGFLSTNDLNMPGNFGLKDQNLALHWVQQNIASFGGNPKMVTLFGQSAGAISAHMHVLSKLSEGLFHNMIALSGTANVPFAITAEPLEQARRIAELCNISNARELSTAKLTRALRSIDAATLINSGDGLKYWHVDHMTNFRPVVECTGADDDAFLTQHPQQLLVEGNYKAVPWLLGGVPHEGAVRVLSILENDTLKADFNANFDELLEFLMEFPSSFNRTQLDAKMKRIVAEYFQGQHTLNDETAQGFLDTVTDRGFHQPYFNSIKNYVNTMNVDRQPVYLYKFNYSGPHSYANIYMGGRSVRHYGVVHCDDLIYLFRAPLLFPDFERNSTQAAFIKAFVDYFVHFAKFGVPQNAELLKPCSKLTFNSAPGTICDYQEFLNDGDEAPNFFKIKTDNKFNQRRIELWNEILEEPSDVCHLDVSVECSSVQQKFNGLEIETF